MQFDLIDSYVEDKKWINPSIRVCKNCVMDETEPFTSFDSDGVCSNCRDYEKNAPFRLKSKQSGSKELEILVDTIKSTGRPLDYDCVVGVSGGADSSYLVYKAKELGLRPIAVHLDNGWNSELAVHNIHALLDKLKIDLDTTVLDWEEFRSLQLAFLRSSTPDVEVPTDHAIWACLMKASAKFKTPYIITGANYATENVAMHGWSYGHTDWVYIKNINKTYGTQTLKTFPHYSLFGLGFNLTVKRIKFISLLNYLDYDKSNAVVELQENLGWRAYKDKHGESTYTKFIQTILLPVKFGFDKRKAHLSSEILSETGGMTRERALEILTECPFDPKTASEDIEYVLKKLQISPDEFKRILSEAPKAFTDYKNQFKLIVRLKTFQYFLRRLGLFPL